MGKILGPEEKFGYLSLIPVLTLMSLFSAGPLIYAFTLSFQKYKLSEFGSGQPFIFLENYKALMESPFFLPALANTLIFTAGSVLLVFIIALCFSLVLNENYRGSIWLRAILLIPWAIPEIGNALAWRWIFDGNWGVWNGLMVYVFKVFDSYQSWLGDPKYAMLSVIIAHVWKETPLATVLLLTGLSTIPRSLYDAAKVDGANIFARFRKITLPMMKPILQLVLVYETILGITSFAYVFVLTGGGPGYSTTTLSWLIWMTSFGFGDFGEGCSVAVIMALISVFLIYLYFKLLPTRQFGSITVR